MFSVIYTFKIKANQTNVFEKSWHDLTALIYEFEGSFGSRLHKKDELNYVAYAQWPDKATWQSFGNNLPAIAKKISATMQASCESSETLFELHIVDDLLSKHQHSN